MKRARALLLLAAPRGARHDRRLWRLGRVQRRFAAALLRDRAAGRSRAARRFCEHRQLARPEHPRPAPCPPQPPARRNRARHAVDRRAAFRPRRGRQRRLGARCAHRRRDRRGDALGPLDERRGARPRRIAVCRYLRAVGRRHRDRRRGAGVPPLGQCDQGGCDDPDRFVSRRRADQPAPPPPPPAPPKVDCGDADHSAFDFWIGDWDCRRRAPRVIAHSRIEKIVGCAISETYDQSRPGSKPSRLSRALHQHGYARPDAGDWRQFYTDKHGRGATLAGGCRDGAMVFTSDASGRRQPHDVKPNPDGSVAQRGEFSTDDGKTWTPAPYDFTYRRRAAT